MPSVRGVEIFVRRIGQGRPVVVLHGGPGADHEYLRPGFDALAQGRELIYYDQRGGGRSPVARDVPVGWTEQVADLEALRELWALDRMTIAGYSWGGLLALLYALEQPDRVERLALVSPAPVWRAARDGFEQAFAKRNLDPVLQEERRVLRESGLRERDPAAFQQRIFELSVAPVLPRSRPGPRAHALSDRGADTAGGLGKSRGLRPPTSPSDASRHSIAGPPRGERSHSDRGGEHRGRVDRRRIPPPPTVRPCTVRRGI